MKNSAAFSWKENGLQQQAYRFLIAEDHHLTGVFDSVKAAPFQFRFKSRATDIAVYVPDFAANDAPLASGLGAEQMRDPGIRRERRWT
ncbi:hypothetical protein [Phaeobacter sp. HF9A]|uniref:hypothetical protein n=1 Tax=Phaeobacter sp. HF9A TaxID=2721561 RepID=UPI00158DB538